MNLFIRKAIMLFIVLMGIALINYPALATDVGGNIEANTTWELAGSPYNVTANIQVAEGVTLTIEPGTMIDGNLNYLKIFGILHAVGNPTSKIYFSNLNIETMGDQPSLINIEYSILNGCSLWDNSGEGVFNLKDSKIEDNLKNWYIHYPPADCYIERNIFINSYGIHVLTQHSVQVYVRNNVFYNQLDYAIENDANYHDSNTIVEYNSFLSTDRIAMALDGDNALMTGVNNFWNTDDTSIIDEMIYDKNDDFVCDGYIEYIPFLTQPHPDTPTLTINHCVANETELTVALNEAKDNGAHDVIKIQQGTYNGNFVYSSMESFGVTIEGGYTVGCASRVVDPANTVFDGGQNGVVLALSAPDIYADFVVDALTLQNGNVIDYSGGGLYAVTKGAVTLTNNTISDNNAEGPHILGGGGVYIDSNSGTITFTNNIISDNSARNRGGGGGIYFHRVGTVNLTANIISENSADGSGGGIWFDRPSGKITLTNNTIRGNSAQHKAGGIIFNSSSLSSTIILINNKISYNSAQHEAGGIYFNSRFTPTLINNIISYNSAQSTGGGIWFNDPSGTVNLTNNTISYNSAQSTGGGISLTLKYNDSVSNIYNNIIWNNNAINEGGDLYIENDADNNYIPSPVNLFNNDFDQGANGTYIQIPFSIDSSNLDNEDPLFHINYIVGDVVEQFNTFHLRSDSPCIDAGTSQNAPNHDIDGDPRPWGAGVDIGADECIPPEDYWTEDRMRDAGTLPMGVVVP